MRRETTRPEKFDHAGAWVRWRRESTRYSLRDFASMFQKSHTWLQRVESGEIKATRELIEGVARITGVDPTEGLQLLNGNESSYEVPAPASNLRDPVDLAAAKYLRSIGASDNFETEYTEEEKADLREGMEMVIAGWFAKRQRKKAEDRKKRD